jgi:hypothetical protein
MAPAPAMTEAWNHNYDGLCFNMPLALP